MFATITAANQLNNLLLPRVSGHLGPHQRSFIVHVRRMVWIIHIELHKQQIQYNGLLRYRVTILGASISRFRLSQVSSSATARLRLGLVLKLGRREVLDACCSADSFGHEGTVSRRTANKTLTKLY